MNRGTLTRMAAFCLLVWAVAACPAAGGHETAAPYPAAETAALLVKWFSGAGFDVRTSSGKNGEKRIVASRGEDRWVVRVSSHSPLASRVEAERTVGGKAVPGAGEEIDRRIAAYGNAPADRAATDSETAPPPAVLQRRAGVVCVRAKERAGTLRFTGFLVGRDGLVLSIAHDLEGAGEFSVVLRSGEKRRAKPVRRDPAKDLLLLDIGDGAKEPIPLEGSRNLLEADERVYAIVCSGTSEESVRDGVVPGTMNRVGGQPLWPVIMETLPGDSGSPVFDAGGRLVGVVKGRLRGAATSGFFIPMETVIDFLRGRREP